MIFFADFVSSELFRPYVIMIFPVLVLLLYAILIACDFNALSSCIHHSLLVKSCVSNGILSVTNGWAGGCYRYVCLSRVGLNLIPMYMYNGQASV